MYKSSYLGLIVTVIMTAWFFLPIKPKAYQYETEVRSLAFSYGIYRQTVCPNKLQLRLLKHQYIRTIPQTNVTDRSWVDSNFEFVFSKECLKHEQLRSGE